MYIPVHWFNMSYWLPEHQKQLCGLLKIYAFIKEKLNWYFYDGGQRQIINSVKMNKHIIMCHNVVSWMKQYRRDGGKGTLPIIMNTVSVKKVLKFQAIKVLFYIFMVFCSNVLLESGGHQTCLEKRNKN